MSDYVPLSAREPLTFTITKPERGKEPLKCVLRWPSPSEKQTITARMFEAGLRRPAPGQIRSAQINALMKLLPADEADAAAEKVERYYALVDQYAKDRAEWLVREASRKFDEANGAEPIEAEPEPPHPVDKTLRRETEMLFYQASEDPLVTRLFAERQRFDAEHAFWLVQAHIRPETVTPFPLTFEKVGNSESLMTRQALDDFIDYVGNHAFDALADFIDRSYGLSGDEEKNFVSDHGIWPPPESPSPEPSEPSEKQPGPGTPSPIEPTPAGESETTIEPSSNTSSEPIGSMENTSLTAAPE